MSAPALLVPVVAPPTVAMERRRFPRSDCHLKAWFQPLGDDPGAAVPATVINISRGGIALHANCRLQPGLLLFVEFQSPAQTQSRKTMVSVVHERRVQLSGGWIAGCAFARPLTEFDVEAVLSS